ncbi:MAG: hypothetical protein JWP58_4665, partial [Hymenobacter sp.]|nr:hypothetical protein [Hymenobacter sp.]
MHHSDTGEHIHDSNNVLQYIDFPTCAETNKPLSLKYNSDGPQNCTITIDDPLFHLLEFYIHNDAPLSCRVPSRPPFSVSLRPLNTETAADLKEEEKDEFVPLIFALTGQLQLSHLHVNTRMNVLLHSVPKHHRQKRDSGVIDSGTAYSTSPLSASGHTKRVVIGDELTLQFHVRWFQSPELALGAGGGG